MKEQKSPVAIPEKNKPEINPTQKGAPQAPQAPTGQVQVSENGIMMMIGRLTVEKAVIAEQLQSAQMGLKILQDKIAELNTELAVLKASGKKDPEPKVPA